MIKTLSALQPLSSGELRDLAAHALYEGMSAQYAEGVIVTRELQARLFLTLEMMAAEIAFLQRQRQLGASGVQQP